MSFVGRLLRPHLVYGFLTTEANAVVKPIHAKAMPVILTTDEERDGDCVRLITRGGYNWTDRYPWIVEAARKVRQRRFVLDGEAVVLGVDGASDFNALHSREPSSAGR